MKTIELNRFKKVVVHDFHNTYSLFGMSLLILMLIPTALWLLGLSFKESVMPPDIRMNIIRFVVFLTAAISSMKIFGSCNLVGRGNYFAMLPATLSEKFWSMLLYCFIVCPLVSFVGMYAVDTLLSLLPFGPYRDFLWDIPDWRRVQISYGIYSPLQSFFSTVGKLLCCTSVFMLANTIFKKNKFIKTILWLMLIGFVFVMIVVPIMGNIEFDWNWWLEKMLNNFKNLDQRKFTNILFWSGFIFDMVFSGVLLTITYLRLKKMQY